MVNPKVMEDLLKAGRIGRIKHIAEEFYLPELSNRVAAKAFKYPKSLEDFVIELHKSNDKVTKAMSNEVQAIFAGVWLDGWKARRLYCTHDDPWH